MDKKDIKNSIKEKTKENYTKLSQDETALKRSLQKIKEIPKSQQKRVLKALPKKMREFAQANLFYD
jgi:hypothetical protein